MKVLLAILQLLSGLFFFSAATIAALSHNWNALPLFIAAITTIAAFVLTLHKNMNQHE